MAPNWLTDRPFAHRGLHDLEVPENSLWSIEKAMTANYGVEIDVRLTGDHQLIVFHDHDTHRMTGHTHLIKESSLKLLQELRLGRSEQVIPTLELILETINGATPLLIEVKNSGMPGPLESRLAELIKSYHGPLAVMSFNPLVLLWFKRFAPQVLRGQLGGSGGIDEVPQYLRPILSHSIRSMPFNRMTRPGFVAYDISDFPQPKLTHLRASLPLLAWTIRDEDGLKKALRHSDNFIFDHWAGFAPTC